MFKGLFHWIAGIFRRRPYRINLERHGNHLQLKANKGKKAIPVAYLAEHYEELRSLKSLQSSKDMLIVPISMLSEIKQVLSNLDNKRFEVLISEGADNLQAVSMPEGFEVRYVWVDGLSYVKQTVADGVAYLGDGWFLLGDAYWEVEGTSEEDDKWLRMEAITGEDILTLITRKVREWKERELPYICVVKYSDEPLFLLTIKEVTEDAVELHVTFRIDPASAKEIPSLGNHIMVAETIMPGFAPAKLFGGMFTKTGTYRLRGELIPHFLMNVLPKVLKWTDGKKEALRSRHRVIQDECELILSLVREEQNGIGVVSALPELVCGSFRRKAEEISRELSNNKRFIRIEPGWVPIEKLRQIGIGPLGVADDGSSLSPIPLTPTEVLNRGSDRLRGPCSRIEAPELRFPQGKDAQDTARLHLEFLRAWGLPGGILGERDFHVDAFYEMFSTLLSKSPQVKVLVIAAKKTLDSLREEWSNIIAARFEGTRKDPEFKASIQGVVLATPKALEAIPAITSVKWTVLCLLEADSLVKSGTSKLFKSLLECRKTLTIGLFSGIDFLKRTSTREALSQVFGISSRDGSLLWKYGLRNPAEHAPSAPLAYRLPPRQQTGTGASGPAEFTLGSSPGSKSIPIPPRPVYVEPAAVATEEKSSIELKDLGIRIEISYSTGYSGSADKFIQDAKKAVNHRGTTVAHVPFMCYWPTYDSMTSSQLKWYFYWRSMVRDGKYPDSDLSYIFVLIYELINNVGVKDAKDGYEQLRRVWLNYRDRQPKLDNYLIDWIFDYALINKYPADPMEVLREAFRVTAIPRYNYIDLVLPWYITGSLVEIPLVLIDSISNYRILRSKFFNEGYQSVVEEFIPRSLDEVNRHMTEKFGAGIFGLFKPKSCSPVERYPYQSALYSGRLGTIKMGNIVSYSQHAPLRDFIASTVKHTENRLREANNYKGRLRGYSIEPEIQKIIDNLIPSAPPKTVPVFPPKQEIVIDFSRVQTLIKQSDQVLQMLQTGEEKGSEKLAEYLITSQQDIAGKIARPEGTPDHLLTDLDSVHEVLARLDNDEKGLIKALMRHGWEVEASVLSEELPGKFIEFMVDRVNSLSLEMLGDLLIVAENQTKVVAEDFRDELEHLLLANAGAPAMNRQGAEQDQSTGDDLPEEWAQFRAALKEHQHQALRAILAMEDPSEELARLADESAIMPEFLIDSINELALDTVGDIIIAPGSAPPAIEEEDLEFVRKLVQA
ncbi:MAG: TerB N-terminal domain-containing protein [Deltaproteobacteria bacterium]|nr:TerB N-terminal domain-containing protein [Deltaproteobacteria bacterium]